MSGIHCPLCKENEVFKPHYVRFVENSGREFHLDCGYCGTVWVLYQQDGELKIRDRDERRDSTN